MFKPSCWHSWHGTASVSSRRGANWSELLDTITTPGPLFSFFWGRLVGRLTPGVPASSLRLVCVGVHWSTSRSTAKYSRSGVDVAHTDHVGTRREGRSRGPSCEEGTSRAHLKGSALFFEEVGAASETQR